jgi:hypothetical protein
MGGTIALNGVSNTVGTHLLKKDKNRLYFPVQTKEMSAQKLVTCQQ